MKKNIFKSITTILSIAVLITLTTACGESNVSMSTSLFVGNNTDVTLESLKLTPENPSLSEPVEVLDSPLAPGAARLVSISLPEKQAKKSEWTVLPVTEEGKSQSRPFTFGELNPHADHPVRGFYVEWFDRDDGHYGAGVSKASLEEYLDMNPHLYAEGETGGSPDAAGRIGVEKGNSLLAVDEKYLTEGNPNYGYIIFFADGGVFVEEVNGELDGHYTVDGLEISAHLDNGEDEDDFVFTIVDADTLELPNGSDYKPTRYIREGSL